MKITQFQEIIKAISLSDHLIPILVEGEMGIGKSQAVQQVAKELGFTYVDLRLAQQDPGDLVGIPRVNSAGDMIWAKPCWIPNSDVKLMLVLEEFNRAPIDVQQAMFQALTENKIHTHLLPNRSMIVICNNPPDSIYHVADLDPAILNRCIMLNLVCDVEEWLTWMHTIKGDGRVIQFISTQTDLLCKPIAGEPSPTPRSWKYVSDVINILSSNNSIEVISGLVGKTATLTFDKWLRNEYNKPVSGKEILEDYPSIREKLLKQTNDQHWATTRDLLALLQAAKTLSGKKQIANMVSYIKDITGEWKSRIVNGLPNKISEILSETEVTKDIVSVLQQTSELKEKDRLQQEEVEKANTSRKEGT